MILIVWSFQLRKYGINSLPQTISWTGCETKHKSVASVSVHTVQQKKQTIQCHSIRFIEQTESIEWRPEQFISLKLGIHTEV